MRRAGRFIGRSGPKRQGDLGDNDPLSGVANLFDLGLVFMIGLMLMLLTALRLQDLMDPDSTVTVTKETSKGEIEIITKKGRRIRAVKVTGKRGKGLGTRLGTAYRLEDGTMIYVPEPGRDGEDGGGRP